MLPRYDERVVITPEARAEALEILLRGDRTYSIAFVTESGTAVRKFDQTKAEVIAQSRLYQHFQVIQKGELNFTSVATPTST